MLGVSAEGPMKSEDTVLAAIAGYVDTLSFVALFGLFTAHVTGNFVLIGAGFAGYGQGLVLKLFAFPAFVAGVVLSSALVRAQSGPEQPLRSARTLYAVQAVLLFGFCAAGVHASPVTPDDVSTVVSGMIGAAAMGVQNAHSRLILRPGVPNTVMTGNVTQVILDVFDMLSPRVSDELREVARTRFAKMLPAVVAFAAGAIGGALGYRHAGFWAMLLPGAALAWLACMVRSRVAAAAGL
ncbi:uncharacterized membrane protein YoaK (UPF0700 family) [Paraburkholderia sp. GAS448]